MKKLFCEYDLLKDDGSKELVKKEIESTEKPPMSFWAGAQPLVTVLWIQKETLIKRVEELEKQLGIED